MGDTLDQLVTCRGELLAVARPVHGLCVIPAEGGDGERRALGEPCWQLGEPCCWQLGVNLLAVRRQESLAGNGGRSPL